MIDGFLVRAALGASLLGAAAGPLGCFVLWRRMAYLGESVSHIGLLGAAVGLLIGIDALWGTAVLALLAAFVMARGESRFIPMDTHVGIVGHIGLALGYVVLAGMENVRGDLLGYLFGDVLALSVADLGWVAAASLAILTATAFLWRPLLRLAVSGDIALAEGQMGKLPQTAFLVLVALLVAFGLKVVGALMIVALLIIPPAAARPLADSPGKMALLAALVGAVSSPLGLGAAYVFDAPAGPCIVLSAGAIFVLVSVAGHLAKGRPRSAKQ
jgi:zinc transport system permease protein